MASLYDKYKNEVLPLRDLIRYSENPDALLADGFDDAFIGICEQFGRPSVAAYNKEKCIQILIDRDGMDFQEAEEFFSFNVVGAWVSENTPVYVTLWESDDD